MASENSNSLSKQEAIEQLRQTIRQLETITEQLEDTSVIDLPSSTSIQNLIATATELEKIIAQKSALQDNRIKEQLKNNTVISAEKVDPEPENKAVTSEPEIRIFEPAPAKAKIKEKSPESEVQPNPIIENQLQANKYKRTLIGIAAALLLIIVPLSWKLFLTNKSPQLIAQDTPDIIQPAAEPIVIPNPVREIEPLVDDKIAQKDVPAIPQNTPDIIQPATEPVVISTPVKETEPLVNDKIAQKDVLAPENIIEPKTNLTPEISSELVAEKPRKLAIETIDPNIQLTPEQKLIAALESKTNNLASRYNDDLVISIKPDFTDSVVVVTVADRWYEITAPRQDKIVSEMLKRSRSLEFDKLKITDSQNNLIARSPLIGEDMIILRRTA